MSGTKASWTPERRVAMSKRLIGNKYTLGYRPSAETRRKMSEAHRSKGRPSSVWTEEQREKVRAQLLGRRLPTETRRRISAAQKGRPLSEINRLGIKAAWNTKEKRQFAKARALRMWRSKARREQQAIVVAEMNRVRYLSNPTGLERALLALLVDFPKVIPQRRFGRYVVDAYLPTPYHLAFEADGEYWHQNAGKDAIRDRYLLERFGLPVVRMSEEDLNGTR